MKTRCKNRSQGAFTLMEVLFAMFAATMCAMIYAATTLSSTTSREMVDRTARALSVAQRQMEAVRAAGFVNLNPANLYGKGLLDSVTPVRGNAYSFTSVDAGVSDSVAQLLPQGTGRVVLESAAPELMTVSVVVEWRQQGRDRSVVLSTQVAKL